VFRYLGIVTPRAFGFAQRVSSAYAVAPIFLIRLAGAPFEALERLATPDTISVARELAACREASARARAEAEDFFRSPEHTLSETAFRALRTAVRSQRVPAGMTGAQPPIFTNYANAATRESEIDRKLEAALEHDLGVARDALWSAARTFLPRYLIFSTGGVRELLADLLSTNGEVKHGKRNARAGDRERHLLLYLQRVCGKNDTFSEFGPTVWGSSDRQTDGLRFVPKPGIHARDTYFERWVAHAIAALINGDPDVVTEGTPIQVPALEPKAFETLYDDVRKWNAGKAREKWLPILEQLAELPQKFANAKEPMARQAVLNDADIRLHELGAARKGGERFLYSAQNPIGEECFRDCVFEISERLLDEVPVAAEPWIDLWRDTYAFVASRVAAGLRPIFERAASKRTALPLPEFLRACEMAKLPLTGPGLVALATMAFQEVKALFREQLRPHLENAEHELSIDDCHIVRRKLDYPKFDEYTYPSADLQISAESIDALHQGQYQWILSELHPPVALLHHCMYWACPNKKGLNEAFTRTVGGHPNFHFGFFAADFTAHTTVRLFEAMPDLSYFVAPQRSNPDWQTISPADAEVYIDSDTGDVCGRTAGSHKFLGSFARAWVIPLGFHPFQFGFPPHTPRLRCGRVIVQRRSWTLTQEEFPAGNYSGVSRGLAVAIDQLRAKENWPRHVYIRPTERALRRSGAEGRDKDTKPVFIDLESYLFHEIFYRWLMKAGELEVTEMLPDPDHLLWREADGRRTFELRTLIVPRK
jgi:lantibiotic biosynthesis dehydratase-like protein